MATRTRPTTCSPSSSPPAGPGPTRPRSARTATSSVDHYHWLVDHGLPFKAEFFPERDREPPTDAGLVYSGGEDSWPFTDVAKGAPRGHHPQHPDAAGGFIMQCLLAALERTEARVQTEAQVDQLVVDGEGAVVGVVAVIDGQRRTIEARKGVVLTAGGFIYNPAMVEENTPLAAHCVFYVGTDTDDGSGIRMGVGAGGAAVNLDALECSLPLNPPRKISVGILVNGKGERFINEDTYNGRIGLEILLRQDEEAYLVFDEEGYVVNVVGMRATWVCETATELAEEIGLPAGALEATVDRYNEAAARGEDPDFHKVPELVRPLVPPLGAIDLRVANAIYAPFTLGGLDTTPDSEVRGRGRHRRPRPLRRGAHHLRHRRPGLRQRHLPRRRQLLRPSRRQGRRLPRLTAVPRRVGDGPCPTSSSDPSSASPTPPRRPSGSRSTGRARSRSSGPRPRPSASRVTTTPWW